MNKMVFFHRNEKINGRRLHAKLVSADIVSKTVNYKRESVVTNIDFSLGSLSFSATINGEKSQIF